jgi:Flp pilus assembly protein TadG
MLLALGCIELGRAVATYTIACSAARAGAEYGATHGYTSYTYSSWQNLVTRQAQNAVQGNPAFDPTLLSIQVSATSETGGYNLATVTANYQFTTITSWPGLPHEFNITHTVAMRRFR